MLRKFVYLCQYMDDWETFNETPEKEDFYNHLNMEDIINASSTHAKKVCKDFEIKTLEEYHDFYNEINILLLADVFENFWNMCLEIYELDRAKCFPAPELGWQPASKREKWKQLL